MKEFLKEVKQQSDETKWFGVIDGENYINNVIEVFSKRLMNGGNSDCTTDKDEEWLLNKLKVTCNEKEKFDMKTSPQSLKVYIKKLKNGVAMMPLNRSALFFTVRLKLQLTTAVVSCNCELKLC